MENQVKELIAYKEIDLNDFADHHDLYQKLDYDGSLHEIVDGNIDIYYYDLRKWAVENYNYIDDAIEEGLCEGSDFHKQIQSGQYVKLNEEMNEVVEKIFKEN